MNNRKEAVHHAFQQLETEIENFMSSNNVSEITRMNFLEQSAQYLGVYVENNSQDLLADTAIN